MADETNANPAERPTGLPDNFQSVEALAKSYRELQGQFTQSRQQATDPAGFPTQAPPPPPPQAPPQSALGIQPPPSSGSGLGAYVAQFSQEWNQNRALSDQSYARIKQERNLDREEVDAFIQGQVAHNSQIEQAGFNAAGGPDNYKQLQNWASQNLNDREIKSYNAAMSSGDPFAVDNFVRGMRVRMAETTGNPDLMQATAGTFSVQNQGDLQPYESEKDWIEDQCSDEYGTDSKFREKVIQRMAITKEVYDDPRKPKGSRDSFLDGALKNLRL